MEDLVLLLWIIAAVVAIFALSKSIQKLFAQYNKSAPCEDLAHSFNTSEELNAECATFCDEFLDLEEYSLDFCEYGEKLSLLKVKLKSNQAKRRAAAKQKLAKKQSA